MTITRNFKLCLNAGVGLAPYINVNQYDQGEQWVFTLYQEDGTQYTPSTGAIVGIKADHLGIINTGTVVDGKVVINETEQMTAAAGKAIFELLIDNGTHGTANFVVMVEPKPGNNADYSESDISMFQQAVDSASEIIDLLNGETVDEKLLPIVQSETGDWLTDHITNPSNPPIDTSLTVAGAAADAKKTGDEIADLKSAIHPYTDEWYPFKYDVPKEDFPNNGYIATASGEVVSPSDTNWLNTDFIKVDVGAVISGKLFLGLTGVVNSISCYDSDFVYMQSASKPNKLENETFTVPSGVSYVRMCCAAQYTGQYFSIENGAYKQGFNVYIENRVNGAKKNTNLIMIGDSYGIQNTDEDITKFYWEYVRDGLNLAETIFSPSSV